MAVHCFKEQKPSTVTAIPGSGEVRVTGQLAAAPRRRILASKVYGIRRPWAERGVVVHAYNIAAIMTTSVGPTAW